MKSGAAFLPIDPDFPKDRIEYMIRESHARYILKYITNTENNEKINFNDIISYSLEHHNYNDNTSNIENINRYDDLCYILFTSGTTGKPKGAMITHNNLINYCLYGQSINGDEVFINEYERVLSIAKFTFDMSISEIFLNILKNKTIIICNDNEYNDPESIGKNIIKYNADFFISTPLRINKYIKNEVYKKSLKNIKCILVGGESVNYESIKNIMDNTDAKIYNLYGPTETTMTCTLLDISKNYSRDDNKMETITIGKSTCNSKIYILDEAMKPVPIGVEGEIYIGGYGVGKGYLNREELTKEKFIECPFSTSDDDPHQKIMYKTGDLGKWTPEGEIICLGRIDFQVKIHGQKIELQEIENTIKEIKEIKHTVVIDKSKSNGEKYLMCYYIPWDENINNGNNEIRNSNTNNNTDNTNIQGKMIRNYLMKKLPRYMVPNYYKRISEIPLSSSGKLNRKALPEPEENDFINENYIAPESEMEEKLCEIFNEIFNLGTQKIGRTSDFYELGGDSFMAIKLISLIEKYLNVKINMNNIINNSKISNMSKFIEDKMIDISNKSIEVIKKRNCKEFPVTSQQLGVYIDSVKNYGTTIYNVPIILKLKENVFIDRVKKSFLKLFESQEILKTRYVEKIIEDGKLEVHGVVCDECKLEFEEYNVDTIQNFIRPFDLSKAPLIRVGFVENKLLLIDIHHIISDGISISIIKKELNKYYHNENMDDLESRIQFSDYSINLSEKKNNNYFEDQIKFYKNMFDNDYEVISLPKYSELHYKSNVYENENGNDRKISSINVFSKTLDINTSQLINEYIRNHEITKTSLFLTLYGYILSKYTNQDNIFTSVVNINRNNFYIQNMIGMFASTQPLLLNYGNQDDNENFLFKIKKNMKILIKIQEEENISYSELKQKINNLKNLNNVFIFQPRSILRNDSENSIFREEDRSESINISESETDENLYNQFETEFNNKSLNKFDIAFNIIEDTNYSIYVQYNDSIYHPSIINNVIESFIEALKHIDQFDNRSNTIEYIPPNEKEKILREFNSNEYKYEFNKFYHEEFKRIAKENSSKCAVICNGIELNYGELDQMSNSLAYYLRNNAKIGRNEIIPIISERSVFYVIAVIAVMKSGAAFLPIDPDFPKDRIEYMIRESHARYILKYITNTENNEKINFNDIISYSLEHHNYNDNTSNIENINRYDDLCYILFTSGTTGKPKGAMITHNNLINYCLYGQSINGDEVFINEYERVLSIAKFTFDMSISEIFLNILKNKTIIICNDNEYNDPESIGKNIIKYNADFFISTPLRINKYIKNEVYKKSLKNIKCILVGGESVNYESIKNIMDNTDTKIYNLYGPTETTMTCTLLDISKNYSRNDNKMETITIGKSTCNSKIYILDEAMKPVPIGVEGEIYIGGYGVGKGYLNREELTKEKFIECPFSTSDDDPHQKIMYKTGDLGKWTPEGEIICLGRIDFQVKIHGQRIELQEIENTIKEIKEIKHAVVIDKSKSNGEKYLMCYYIPWDENINNGNNEIRNSNTNNNTDNTNIQGKMIRNYLMKKLPRYMVPNYYKRISEIPLSSSGKLNRKALPEPEENDFINENYIAPESEMEEKLCEIFNEIFNLGTQKIGRTSDFYELGGDSFMAIKLISLIEKYLNVKISMKSINNHSKILYLSKFIEDKIKSENLKNNNIIKKRNCKEFPVTPQQLGIYIDSIKNSNSIIYNMIHVFELKKNISIEKIKKCFIKIFESQEILRTRYTEKVIENNKTKIYGFIDDECKLEFEEYTSENIQNFIRPFNLSKAPLLRIGFVDNKLLLIDIHHIITDGFSMSLIFELLNKLYYMDIESCNDNLEEKLKLDIEYSDYAIDMYEKRKSNYFKNQYKFYENMFNCEYDIVNIPKGKAYSYDTNNFNNFQNDKKNSYHVSRITKSINRKESSIINKYILSNDISKTAFFFTIYGFILAKYSGNDTVYTSIMTSNRSSHYVENMIGMFVSTQPILLNYSTEEKGNNVSLHQMLKNVNNTLYNIYNNQDISFSELISALKLKKVNNSFIFQPKSMFNNYKNNTIFTDDGVKDIFSLFNNEKLDNIEISNNSKFDITFFVFEDEDNYEFSIEYNSSLYEFDMIENILNSYIYLINNTFNYNEAINKINYISEGEQVKIINEFNNDVCKDGCNGFYHTEFSTMAKRYPDAIAIIYNDTQITYKELEELTNSLSVYLRRKGITRNDIVPIISDRSPYYIIAKISISKSGGAYLPIDKNLPIERIKYLLEETNPKIVLYNNSENIIEELSSLLKNSDKMKFEFYNLKSHNYSLNSQDVLVNINEPDDTCYVLFTSGTTGKPKGTLVSHFNIYNYLRKFEISEDKRNEDMEQNTLCFYNLVKSRNIKRILAITNFSFDIAHNEINFCLMHGLTTVLADDELYENIELLINYIEEKHVDLINTTPSRFNMFLENDKFKESLNLIKLLVFSGESLSKSLCEDIHKYSNCEIINGYGPTECYFCTFKEINEKEEREISIGKPICNSKIYILDEAMNPVPIGVEGEIYIGGYGVGKGYLNREELTKEKFIECPFSTSDDDPHQKIMYKTGDLGKWTPEGEIICLGRIDFQVKIHGQRIELQEIENTIKEMNEIETAVVIDKSKSNGEKYLMCYYISLSGSDGDDDQGKMIRNYLMKKLPRYMVPNYYKRISEIPLSSNGKLNRKALPEPEENDFINENYIAPESEMEEKLCEIFNEIFNLGTQKIGRTSDFYELGGDSFMAIKLISLIEKYLNVKINMKSINNHSKILYLSKFIEDKIKSENLKNNNIIKKRNCKEFPVTPQQLGIYIDSIKNSNSIIYNMIHVFELKKNISIEKIKKCFIKIFESQEILRTRYTEKVIENNKTKIYGFIDDECKLEFEEYTSENIQNFIRPFNLSKAPLLRIGFVDNKLLLIDIHHIITDGFSMSLIFELLNKLYYMDIESCNDNLEEKLKLDIEYSDYAIDMYEKRKSNYFKNQYKFYENMFNCEYDIVNIPKGKAYSYDTNNFNNFQNDKKNSYHLSRITKSINRKESSIINKYILSNDISKTAFFFTIYGFILAKYSGNDTVYTSIMTSNRSSHYVENMIGMFVSTQPILLNYSTEEKGNNVSLHQMLKNVNNTLYNIYNNQDISFSELISALKLKKVNNSFIFQPKSMFNNYKNNTIFTDDGVKDIFSLFNNEKLDNIEISNNSKFDITFFVFEDEDNYEFSIEYNSSLYEFDMIENILNSYIYLINNTFNYNEAINKINYISEGEQVKIINEFNNDVCKDGCNGFYHTEFSTMAKRYPDAIAIIYNDTQITYKELEELTNSLSVYLRRKGITRNDIVPIISDRSPYYIIAKISISKSGGAYLPIDKNLPIERIKYLLEETNPKIVLYNNSENIIEELSSLLKNSDKMKFEFYNLKSHNYSLNSQDVLVNINEPDDTCYVLFTSGTTGKPKGTLVSHFNIYNYLRKFEISEDKRNEDMEQNTLCFYNLVKSRNIKRILAITNFSFDIAHNEINFCLMHGLTTVLADDELYENIELLINYIEEKHVDLINTTPSRFNMFLENDKFKESLNLIKLLVFSGESLSKSLCEDIHKYSNCEIINGYGPTECYFCTFKEINEKEEREISIGKPICNSKIYILDEAMNPVPIGVEGEIYIGGYGVGKGYLNREELTKEKFIECPFSTSDDDPHQKIMYKTGDLGKWTPEGEIICLGRIDFQVKIHGQRIELQEIENTIKEMNEIETAVVIDKSKSNGEKYLMCYYISLSGSDGDDDQGKMIRNYLMKKLPRYMVPNYYKRISEIPLSSNGKLNRKALPEPEENDFINENYIAPESEMEEKLCEIFNELFNLGTQKIGRTSDFYELGGDSFMAIKLISLIEKYLNVKINMKSINDHSKIYSLASFIIKKMNKESNSDSETIKRYGNMEYPATSILSSFPINYKTLDLEELHTYSTNIIQFYKLNNKIDVEKLEKTVNMILNRHQVLKTVFIEKNSNENQKVIYGKIRKNITLNIENYTIENFHEFIRPYDITKDHLIRIGIIDNTVLVIDINHLIADGYSFGLFLNEISKLYNDEVLESSLPIQYSDYSIYYDGKTSSNEFLNQLSYYKEMFNEDFESLNLDKYILTYPSLQNNPNFKKYNEISVNTDSKIYNIINNISKTYNLSKTAIFLTVFSLVFSIYSNQTKIYSTIISSNRNSSLTENLIGLFVRFIPVLLKIENTNLIQLIRNVTNILYTIFSHDIPFSVVSEQLSLPECNYWFKFDPYNMMNNETIDFGESLSLEEVYDKFQRKDLLKQISSPSNESTKNTLDLLTRDCSTDFIIVITENRNNYNINVTFNQIKYNDEFINGIINKLIDIIGNENNFKNESLTINELKAIHCNSKKQNKQNSIQEQMEQTTIQNQNEQNHIQEQYEQTIIQNQNKQKCIQEQNKQNNDKIKKRKDTHRSIIKPKKLLKTIIKKITKLFKRNKNSK